MSIPPWWRVRRASLLSAGQLWLGFVALGSFFGLVVPPDSLQEIAADLRFLRGLPTGHPEHLVPDRSPTPQELELWGQLGFLDRQAPAFRSSAQPVGDARKYR